MEPISMSAPIPEIPVIFTCADQRLLGIATQPHHPQSLGVLIVVGGPQYRAGSHRQFTLLSRSLAKEGIASFRFDYRGMGDSEGESRNFENIDADIRAAIDQFQISCPSITRIALWGLCDAASAAVIYSPNDRRVVAQVLLNPWVHTEDGAARVRLKNYYLSRIFQKSFWQKLFKGEIKINQSINEIAQTAKIAKSNSSIGDESTKNKIGGPHFIERMLYGIKTYRGSILIILSSDDYVAQEFTNLTNSNKTWKKTFDSPRISTIKIENSNHTFSSASLREEVEKFTIKFIKTIVI